MKHQGTGGKKQDGEDQGGFHGVEGTGADARAKEPTTYSAPDGFSGFRRSIHPAVKRQACPNGQSQFENGRHFARNSPRPLHM